MESKFKKQIQVLGYLSVVGGVILGFVLAKEYGVEVSISSYGYRIVEERNGFLTVLWFVIGVVAGYVEFVLFSGLAEILQFLEKLSLNKEERNSYEHPMLENMAKDYVKGKAIVSKGSVEAGKWRCSKCGKDNYNYVGTCGCGTSK